MPSAQRPIDSGFSAGSTAHDVLAGIDLSGKVAVVTGGHSGIGLETTRALSAAGATVIVPVRYPGKARERLHPGSILTTDLSPWATDEDRRVMNLIDEAGNPVIDPERGAKNAQQGASTSVWCATSPTLDGYGGVYCENNNISPIASPDDLTVRLPGAWPVGVAPYAVNPHTADQLWDLSKRLLEEPYSTRCSSSSSGAEVISYLLTS